MRVVNKLVALLQPNRDISVSVAEGKAPPRQWYTEGPLLSLTLLRG